MSSLLSTRIAVVAIAWKTYGWRGLLRRSRHEVRRRLTRFKTAPTHALRPGDARGAMNYAPGTAWSTLSQSDYETVIARAQRVVKGEYQAFSDRWHTLPSTAQQWRGHPSSVYDFGDAPWWRIALLPPGHDVKEVWEPARFAWVYDLVRAYAVSGEQVYADAFYAHVMRWSEVNPPFLGPHWACGQETSIRALALLHGLDGLPTTDTEAVAHVDTLLGWSGERIADAIGYGLSQRNNHGISEAAGLVHLGLRLRGRHPDAARWVRNGVGWLNEQIDDQFSRDGWYAQHSFTYLRVALEQALMAQRALARSQQSLSKSALSRLRAALDLLTKVIDSASGVVPNHGANDGALTVPFAVAAYRDFRPLVTFGCITLDHPLPQDIAADAVTLCWFDVAPPRSIDPRPDGVARGDSGWAVVRIDQTMVFMWAGKYRHRPSHLDALHIHVWLDGVEVITDAGTFAYNSPPPWKNALGSALVHNAPVVDEQETAARGPRFLWLEWPEATIIELAFNDHEGRLVAQRAGSVRREVRVTAAQVTVRDRLVPGHDGDLQVTWLMHPDAVASHKVATNAAASQAQEGHGIAGWFSPTYAKRVESLSICAQAARGSTLESTIVARNVKER